MVDPQLSVVSIPLGGMIVATHQYCGRCRGRSISCLKFGWVFLSRQSLKCFQVRTCRFPRFSSYLHMLSGNTSVEFERFVFRRAVDITIT